MIRVHADGASKGNPGKASCGYVILKDGVVIASDSISLGIATNNYAEYSGIIFALKKLIELGIKDFEFIGDSQLAINQINGVYKVKHPNIIPLHTEVKKLLKHFNSYTFTHTLRNGNSIADDAANRVFNKRG